MAKIILSDVAFSPAQRFNRNPMKLNRCYSVDDIRKAARNKLPRPVFDCMDGGAETESTMRRNSASFDDVRLVPQCLVDVNTVNLRTRILGQDTAMPLMLSPTGGSRMYHPLGEMAVARAADDSGIFYSLSTVSNCSIEAVAAIGPGPKMFQLYPFRDRAISTQLVERARAAGYHALCITVDGAARGKRERELRSGMGVPLNLTLLSYLHFALRPAWLLSRRGARALTFPSLSPFSGSGRLADQARFVSSQLDPSLTWDDLAHFIQLWDGPVAIKGIMAVSDARRAVDAGASAVIVSNHGGRQLDGAAAPFEVIPAIADAIGGSADIILDGGVRRGTHILKALAAGATACAVGRPYLYGLAAGGSQGVEKVIRILRDELVMAMRLTGCSSVKAAGRGIIWPSA